MHLQYKGKVVQKHRYFKKSHHRHTVATHERVVRPPFEVNKTIARGKSVATLYTRR